MLRAATLAALLLVSGCGANHNAIYRTFSSEIEVGEDASKVDPSLTGFIIDAKQRAMLASYDKAAEKYIYCVEPSPDAFSVLSSSFAASGQLSRNSTDTSAAAQLAKSMNETGSTIARTQTIQILREAMYRTCERYANGSMEKDEMYVQAIRDQRMVVSVLAIEQLTGSITPPAVAISATAEADTGKTALAAQVNLDKAREKLKSSEKDKAAAEALSKAAATTKEKFEADEKKAVDAKKLADDEQDATNKKPLNTEAERLRGIADASKKSANDAAEKSAKQKPTLAEATQSVSDYDKQVKSLIEKRDAALAVSTSGAAKVEFGNCDTCKPGPPSDEAAIKIADTVKEIVDRTFELDEVQLRCLRVIGRDPQKEQRADSEFIDQITDPVAKVAAQATFTAKLEAGNQYFKFCTSYFANQQSLEALEAAQRSTKAARQERLAEQARTEALELRKQNLEAKKALDALEFPAPPESTTN